MKTWKPARQGGNPACRHYAPNVNTNPAPDSDRHRGDQPYMCAPNGECCYRQGHPVDECLECGLALEKDVVGPCGQCGGTVVIWTMGVAFFGGAYIVTEKCTSCGVPRSYTPNQEEHKKLSERHSAQDHERFEQMTANLAKFKK